MKISSAIISGVSIKDRSVTGFTLIEITIALLVMAIGLVGLLALFPLGFDASKKATDITEVTILAQQKMEEIKLGCRTAGSWDAGEYNGTFGTTGYGWEVVITDEPPELCKIVLTVSWTRRGRSYAETFVTKALR